MMVFRALWMAAVGKEESSAAAMDVVLLLEPMERSIEDIKAIFAEIDRLGGNDFLPDGRREQPPMPPANDVPFDR